MVHVDVSLYLIIRMVNLQTIQTEDNGKIIY